MLSNNIFHILFGIVVLIFMSPVIILCSTLIFITSGWPIIFSQKRWGKGKKPFNLYKFRTMVKNAERQKRNLMFLNEADGPVFKIRQDPRYTRIGRILAHTGLDELPQLINIIKGEMVFVGPRPLPVNEAKRIPKKYDARFSVFPGITSLWIVKGSHDLSFSEWMRLDLYYIKNRSIYLDLKIAISTISLILKGLLNRSN